MFLVQTSPSLPNPQQTANQHQSDRYHRDKYQSAYSATDSCSSPAFVVRAVLLGDASVGKSSLSVRYFNDEFPDVYDVTFGGVFFKKEVKVSKDLTVCLQAWDTGGEERYRSMAPLYYRNASIIFLVCSATDHNPTSSLQYWFEELSEKLFKDNITILVLVNKSDLIQNDEAPTIKEWCNSHNL